MPYGWGHLSTLDKALRDAAWDAGASYIDIGRSFRTRPDATLGHVRSNQTDCLHTCLPGPVDSWNRLLWKQLDATNITFAHRALSENEALCTQGMKSTCRVRNERDCLCAAGCTSPRWGCTPSNLCTNTSVATIGTVRVAIVTSLVFHPNFVRNSFKRNATAAYIREYRRILHLIASLRAIDTRLPIVVMVGGERRSDMEAKLSSHGVRVRAVDFVRPPRWASKWHRLSFQKIAALELTEYERVVVLDNDMTAFKNFDAVVQVPAPAAVFHPARSSTESGIVSGFMILEPSDAGVKDAHAHLQLRLNYSAARFDGGDEEFWSSFYRTWYEVPIEFHARFRMGFPNDRWDQVKLFHAISNFASDSASLPRKMRKKVRYY